MKIAGTIFYLVLVTGCCAATPNAPTTIVEVRSVVLAPDRWAGDANFLQKLDLLASHAKGKKKEAIETFRKRFTSYRGYFAGHAFSLTAKERAALTDTVRDYETAFASELQHILAAWRVHPTEDHGCLAAAELARLHADFELEKCGPVFAAHNWSSSRPNELAGVFIDVMRDYGRLLVDLSETPSRVGGSDLLPPRRSSDSTVLGGD